MEHWAELASCAPHNSGLSLAELDAIFFPGIGDSRNDRPSHPAYARAKAICATCPVRAECLADALEHDTGFGVRGGLTAKERSALRRLPHRRWCKGCRGWFLFAGNHNSPVFCHECTVRRKRESNRVRTQERRRQRWPG